MSARMPAPLSRLPIGLLDFLGVKTNGRYPQHLVENVQPVFDLFEQYATNYCEEYLFSTAGNTGAVTNGFTAITAIAGTTNDLVINAGSVVVPPTELWYLMHGATYCQLPAEATAFGRTVLSTAITGGNSLALPSTFQGWDTGVVGLGRSSITTTERPFWIRPGTTLFIQHFGTNSTAAIAISARVRLVRMRI